MYSHDVLAALEDCNDVGMRCKFCLCPNDGSGLEFGCFFCGGSCTLERILKK